MMNLARIRRLFVIVPLLLASALLVAGPRAQTSTAVQQQAPPDATTQQVPADKPQFTTGVDLVMLDVGVVDQNGNPTTGLGAADFVLSVDGAQRAITKVEFVRQSAGTRTAGSEVWSSNEGAAGGRLIMLVIDQGNIGRGGGQALVTGAQRLLNDLGPGDRVALSIIPGGRVVDFTSHIALVRERLRQFAGSSTPFARTRQVQVGLAESLAIDRGDTSVIRTVAERECPPNLPQTQLQECIGQLRTEASNYAAHSKEQTGNSLTALRQLLIGLQTIPAPKTVVLLSQGLVIGRALELVSWVGPVAATSRVSLYAIQLDDTFSDLDASISRSSPTWSEDQQLQRDGLATLAGLARGAMFTSIGRSDSAFVRLSRELTGYYLVGFEPLPAERDGREHEIRIRVNRRGVEIRMRRVFVIDPKESAERSVEERLGDTLRLPLAATDVGVRVATYSLPDPASDKVRVMVAAGVGRPADEAPVTHLAYVVFDNDGRVVGSHAERLPGRTGDDQRYLDTFVVDAGTYTLKLAAVDADGRTGSAEHRFVAKVSASGPITLGDLVLNDSLPGQADALRPAIEPKVTAGSLVAYLDFKTEPNVRDASAALEVAADANGTALAKGPMTMNDGTAGARRIGVATLDVARLPPGEYVARATVFVGGKPVARTVRQFGFDPSSAVLSRVVQPSGFDRSRVLAPPVLEYFLKPLAARPGVAANAVTTALDAARAGDLGTLAETFPGSGSADATTILLRGVGLLARGELEPAAAAFRASLALDSEMSAAIFYLGACYAAGGNDREAVGAWQTVLASDDERPVVFVVTSEAYGRLHDSEAALDTAREAFDRWPDDDAVRLQFAKAAGAAGKRGEALDALGPYIERHPQDHEAIFFGLKLIYDAVADGKRILGPSQDQQLFARYLQAYRVARGPDVALVERWQKALWGK